MKRLSNQFASSKALDKVMKRIGALEERATKSNLKVVDRRSQISNPLFPLPFTIRSQLLTTKYDPSLQIQTIERNAKGAGKGKGSGGNPRVDATVNVDQSRGGPRDGFQASAANWKSGWSVCTAWIKTDACTQNVTATKEGCKSRRQ